MLPEGKPWLCSPCARFLSVWMYEASPAADSTGDTALPLSLRGRDTGRTGKGAHLEGSWELFTGIPGGTQVAGALNTSLRLPAEGHSNGACLCQGQCRSGRARKQLTHPSSLLVSFLCRPEARLPSSNQRASSIQMGTRGAGC